MKFKPEQFAPVSFKVLLNELYRPYKDRWQWVAGYAVDFPDLPVRFAVAEYGFGWMATHWDTGYAMGGLHRDRNNCALNAVAKLRQTIESGELEKRLAKIRPVINVRVT